MRYKLLIKQNMTSKAAPQDESQDSQEAVELSLALPFFLYADDAWPQNRDIYWLVRTGGFLKFFRGSCDIYYDGDTRASDITIGVHSRDGKKWYGGLYVYSMFDKHALVNDSGDGWLEKWFCGPQFMEGPIYWNLIDDD